MPCARFSLAASRNCCRFGQEVNHSRSRDHTAVPAGPDPADEAGSLLQRASTMRSAPSNRPDALRQVLGAEILRPRAERSAVRAAMPTMHEAADPRLEPVCLRGSARGEACCGRVPYLPAVASARARCIFPERGTCGSSTLSTCQTRAAALPAKGAESNTARRNRRPAAAWHHHLTVAAQGTAHDSWGPIKVCRPAARTVSRPAPHTSDIRMICEQMAWFHSSAPHASKHSRSSPMAAAPASASLPVGEPTGWPRAGCSCPYGKSREAYDPTRFRKAPSPPSDAP